MKTGKRKRKQNRKTKRLKENRKEGTNEGKEKGRKKRRKRGKEGKGGGRRKGKEEELNKNKNQNKNLFYSECQNGNSLCKVLQNHKCNRFILTRCQSTVCLRNLLFFNFLIYFWMVTF